LKYRLSIAKTQFHGGLLEVVWQMGVGAATITSDYQSAICYRAVWDIQESNAFDIVVPYVASTPFCQVFKEYPSYVQAPYPQSSCGYLQIRVINPLVTAGGTVADSVEILTYCGGMPDIEFAVPGPHGFVSFPSSMRRRDRRRTRRKYVKLGDDVAVVTSNHPVNNRKGLDDLPDLLERFSFDDKQFDGLVVSACPQMMKGGVYQVDPTDGVDGVEAPMVMAKANPPSLFTLVSCVGERVPNLRLLLKRFSYPNVYTVFNNSQAMFDTSYLYANHEYVFLLSLVFGFYSGGWRVDIMPTSFAAQQYFSQCYASTGFSLPGLGIVRGPILANQSALLDIPYYSMTPYLPMFALETGEGMVSLTWDNRSESDIDADIMFACGDDMTMGFQMGPPTIIWDDPIPNYRIPFADYQ